MPHLHGVELHYLYFKKPVEPILTLDTELEMVAVKIPRKGQHDLIMATIYLPPRKTKQYKRNIFILKPILQNWLESKYDLILAGDFNARNEVFGDNQTKNGTNFAILLNELNLTALIPNTPTRPKSEAFLDFFVMNNPKLLYSPVTYEPNPYPLEKERMAYSV